jgi:hypothetical protein
MMLNTCTYFLYISHYLLGGRYSNWFPANESSVSFCNLHSCLGNNFNLFLSTASSFSCVQFIRLTGTLNKLLLEASNVSKHCKFPISEIKRSRSFQGQCGSLVFSFSQIIKKNKLLNLNFID